MRAVKPELRLLAFPINVSTIKASDYHQLSVILGN